jgi:hypothetical protein
MIESVFLELGPWTWWIAGIALLGLEILVPGTFFLWFGVAALMVGTLALLVPIDLSLQVSIWLGASLVLLVVGRRFFKRKATTDQPLMNDPLGQFVGRSFTLSEPIVEGEGRLKIGDTIWRVTGPDLRAGTKVIVTGAQGTALVVASQS